MEYVVISTATVLEAMYRENRVIEGHFSNYPDAVIFAKRIAGSGGRILLADVSVYERRTKFNVKVTTEEE